MKYLENILIKEKVLKATRDFFYGKYFHEIVTNILNDSIPLEPNLYAFSTTWDNVQNKKQFYLPCSPEKSIKKMLGLGIGNCFSIGHCFRNLEGQSALHNPEFLMLEWYRESANYQDIMAEIKEYILNLNKIINVKNDLNLDGEWEIISLAEKFTEITKIDFKKLLENEQLLFDYAKRENYNIENATWEDLYNQIFVNEIENTFPKTPFFLTDFPAKTSPLCTIQKNKPYLAERFEFYLNNVEIANGNNENTDYELVKKKMENEKMKREKNNEKSQSVDEEFIESLKKMQESGKKFAGVGLGIERLIMLLRGKESINY
jgi:lysyl-tRNA synthetase class 2